MCRDEFTKSLFELKFKVDVKMATLCTLKYSSAEKQKLADAIDDDYYFEFVMDKLPMWGFVGESKSANGGSTKTVTQHPLLSLHG